MLAEIKDKRPDILLSGSYTSDSLVIVKQAKEMGLKPKMFGILLGPTLPGFVESLKQDADNLLEPIQWSANMSWKDDFFGYGAAEFARIFEKDFGYFPDYHPRSRPPRYWCINMPCRKSAISTAKRSVTPSPRPTS